MRSLNLVPIEKSTLQLLIAALAHSSQEKYSPHAELPQIVQANRRFRIRNKIQDKIIKPDFP